MHFLQKSLGLFGVLLLTACASAPRLQAPFPQIVGTAAPTVAAPPADQVKNNLTAFLNTEKSQQYTQYTGGGGVGVGLLLGPIGMIANMSAIEKVTDADAALLRDKIAVDPKGLLLAAADDTAFALAAPSGGVQTKIVPYFIVSKTENDVIRIDLLLMMERGTGAERWRGSYRYQLPTTYTLKGLSELDMPATTQLRANVSTAYGKILTHIKAESAEKFAREPKIKFRAPSLIHTQNVVDFPGTLIQENDDFVWVRTAFGVYAAPKAMIQYTLD